MALKEELGLKRGFDEPAHEALLNVYYTASMMKKRADVFFSKFGLTDVQFNLLTLLYFQSGNQGGLSQVQISDMMLVNRANITSLVDRMEKTGLVKRDSHTNDRRFNIVKLTTKGKALFEKVEPMYIEQVRQIMSPVSRTRMNLLMKILEEVRGTLRN
jgi:MarR family 2-MHQ and catechol resistance regulon transcriptional repressor